MKIKEVYKYAIIIVLQILVILYWAGVKTNYHIDELYSMGYASNFTGVGDKAWYITSSPEFEYNKWVVNSEYKKYLVVSEEEGVSGAPLITFLSKAITGRNYNALLNIAYSIAEYSQVSARPGVVLNILFYIIAEVSLISLMKKLKMDNYVIYLSIIMFGFSGYMISMVEYIRFYMMIIALMLLMLNCFYRLWNADSLKQILGNEFLIIVLEYFSFKNSEFAIPFFGAYMLCFIIALVAGKKRKQYISFGLISLCGIIYIFVTQNLIQTLIDPMGHISKYGVYAGASMNIRNASAVTLKSYFIWLNELIQTQYFAAHTLTYATLAVITFVLIRYTKRDAGNTLGHKTGGISLITVIMGLIWCIIFATSYILNQGRLICMVVLAFIVLTAAAEAAGIELSPGRIRVSMDTVFVCIIAGELIIYTVFDALCQYETWRYYCYGFVSIAVIIWYIIDRLLKIKEIQCVRKQLMVVLTFFVLLNALLPFATRKIENMYEDERAFIESVTDNQGLDVVLVSELEDGTPSRHEVYDLVNMVSEDTRIYALDKNEYRYNDDYPDRFILWSYVDRDVSSVLSDLKRHGYLIRELGEDHCSKAYVCSFEQEGQVIQ